jgi:PAS domain-containing protein
VREPPWLEPPVLEVVDLILSSHQAAFGRPLVAGADPRRNLRLAAQEVFAVDQAVLAHDGTEDPRLIYANAAALRLWRRPWAEMIGMPSRLTAEPQEQRERAQALAIARQQNALSGYTGIRVDTEGRRFRIEGAKVWGLRDAGGRIRGQAAGFSSWVLLWSSDKN